MTLLAKIEAFQNIKKWVDLPLPEFVKACQTAIRWKNIDIMVAIHARPGDFSTVMDAITSQYWQHLSMDQLRSCEQIMQKIDNTYVFQHLKAITEQSFSWESINTWVSRDTHAEQLKSILHKHADLRPHIDAGIWIDQPSLFQKYFHELPPQVVEDVIHSDDIRKMPSPMLVEYPYLNQIKPYTLPINTIRNAWMLYPKEWVNRSILAHGLKMLPIDSRQDGEEFHATWQLDGKYLLMKEYMSHDSIFQRIEQCEKVSDIGSNLGNNFCVESILKSKLYWLYETIFPELYVPWDAVLPMNIPELVQLCGPLSLQSPSLEPLVESTLYML